MPRFEFPSVKEIGSVSNEVQQALLSQLPAQSSFSYILRLPPFQPMWQRRGKIKLRLGQSPEWTLALTVNRLIVVTREVATNQIEVTVIPLASIVAFEWGVILLDSWLDVVWQANGVQRLHVEYNTVAEEIVRSMLEKLQRAVLSRSGLIADRGTPLTEDQINTLPMKFSSLLLKHALLPDEQVYRYCFEPTLKPKWFWGNRRDGLLWAVTNYHSLFAREPREAHPYGVVFTFCPRGEIRAARVVATNTTAELCLTLGEPSFEVTGVFPLSRHADLVAAAALLVPDRVTSA